MTPPVGLNVYVLKGVAKDVSMGDIFRGCGWFGRLCGSPLLRDGCCRHVF